MATSKKTKRDRKDKKKDNKKSTDHKKKTIKDTFKLVKAGTYLSAKNNILRSSKLPAGETDSVQNIAAKSKEIVEQINKKYQ
jgi:hypothetical protein